MYLDSQWLKSTKSDAELFSLRCDNLELMLFTVASESRGKKPSWPGIRMG